MTDPIPAALSPDVEMTPVASSHLKAVGYDPATQTLRIEFRNGAVYDYGGVPEEVYAAFRAAPSPGKALHALIQPVYPARRR